jgi:Hypoxia induced protein conserved region
MTFFAILLILAMIATVVMLVRGIIAFLQTTEADLNSGGDGPSPNQRKQQQMMRNRVLFQALAVVIVVILLAMSRS